MKWYTPASSVTAVRPPTRTGINAAGVPSGNRKVPTSETVTRRFVSIKEAARRISCEYAFDSLTRSASSRGDIDTSIGSSVSDRPGGGATVSIWIGL